MKRRIPVQEPLIIRRTNIEDDVDSIFTPTEHGWAIRSGNKPNNQEPPEKGMPWGSAKSRDKIIEKITQIYTQLREDALVFMHPYRIMVRSGNLLVEGDRCLVEAVNGWPEPLSHGRVLPDAVYIFDTPRTPRLIAQPSEIQGDPSILSRQDLYDIGNLVERRLRYTDLSLTKPVVVEFSFGTAGDLKTHDIRF